MHLQSWAPPGEIGGHVLRGLEPVPGARVCLWREDGAPAPHLRTALIADWTESTDSDGAFSFRDLLAGSYLLRVQTSTGEHQEARVRLLEQAGEQRVVFAFGSSCIEGTVYESAGSLVQGATVRTSRLGPRLGGSERSAHTRTDASGNFRICGLTRGRYWLILDRRPDLDPAGEQSSRPDRFLGSAAADRSREQWIIEVLSSHTHRVVLGEPESLGHWRGRLVDAQGGRIPGLSSVLLVDLESGLERAFAADDDGLFDAPLPEGRYGVGASPYTPNLFDLGLDSGELVMGREDLYRDAVVQGTCVDLRIVYLGAERTSEQVAASIRFSLVSASQGFEKGIGHTRQGQFIVLPGMRPGSYVLRMDGSYCFEGPDERSFSFFVPEGRATVVIEVPIRPRFP